MKFPIKVKKTAIYSLGFLFLLVIFSLPIFDQTNDLLISQVISQLFSSTKTTNKIVLVLIDDNSWKAIKTPVLTSNIFSQFLNKVATNSPKVIGLDTTIIDTNGTLEGLNKANIIYSNKININPNLDKANTQISSNTQQIGIINTNPLKIDLRPFKDQNTNFVEQIYSSYTGSSSQFINGSSDYLYINYSSDPFPTYSFIDILNGKISPNNFKNKIVIIGSSVQNKGSEYNQSFIEFGGKEIPKVEIDANIINSYLENSFKKDLPNFLFISINFVEFVLIYLLLSNIKRTKIIAILIPLTFTLCLIQWWLIYYIGYNWLFVNSIILFMYTIVFGMIMNSINQRQKTEFIQKAFQYYMNHNYVLRLMENPSLLKLGGENKDLAIMFSDIRGFTSLSEKISPKKLIELLNEYLDLMCEVIISNNGTIDKFIGDAIMAFWNAPVDNPNYEWDAIRTGMLMIDKLEEFNKLHPEIEDLKIGIGINRGEVIVGNLGSKKRFDYTVIGDNVNVASRVESLTKRYGISLIITETVLKNLDLTKYPDLIFRLIDDIIVKGRNQAIKIYQPLKNSPGNLLLNKKYELAFQFYQKKNFKKALIILEELKEDPVSFQLISRINKFDELKFIKGTWKLDIK